VNRGENRGEIRKLARIINVLANTGTRLAADALTIIQGERGTMAKTAEGE
jgi:hypothetical protein